MATGGDLGESEREEIGRALLSNKVGKVGYCDIYGLRSNMNNHTFDLKDRDQVRSLRSFVLLCGLLRSNPTIPLTLTLTLTQVRSLRSFVLLCGLLRANSSLTRLTLRSVVAEHVEVLAEALQTNSTLEYLNLEHQGRGSEVSLAVLPVQVS